MSEGCCRLAGLGFSGFDDNMKPVWQDISNIKVKKIEFSSSQKVMIDNWNIGTNVWLRNHIYVRLLPTTGKSSSRATLITFIVSAFWHGFYPGYYMAFVLTSFGTSAARLLRRNLRPVVLAAAKRSVANDKGTDVESTPIKRIYNVLGWFAGMVIFNVCGCTFVLLDASRSLQAWRALYFTPMIGIAAVILAFQTFKLGRFLPKDSGGAVPAVTIKARSDSGNPAGSSK
ncbi:Lysophospholipid acyltransferase [Spiromyces aspiralis]|uniref:Lysophospholipid acyltransferase n=1 Tax=Spiromyces aspiralis TaxID=68401 RepID=A0ACC1HAF1_9FUNG|nr:Lysophospholipid acyltransferase [Spiromyces aspiralis]